MWRHKIVHTDHISSIICLQINYFTHLMKSLPQNWPQNFPYAPWYLNAVSHEWDYITSQHKNGQITGILPFQIKKRMGFRLLTPPSLSPRLGPRLFYPAGLNAQQKQAFEWKTLTALEQQLPQVHYAQINWPYELGNGLAWQMLGWQQTVRYSYCINLNQDKTLIWNHFRNNVKRQIRKARQLLTVNTSIDTEQLWQLCQSSFQQRGKRPPLLEETLKSVTKAGLTQEKAILFEARDQENRLHAMLFLLWDERAAYYLLPFSDLQLRSSGAPSFLIWHAILYAQSKGLKVFDFEGSQLPGIESFFRSFGGEARPYYQFTKTTKWLKIAKILISSK